MIEICLKNGLRMANEINTEVFQRNNADMLSSYIALTFLTDTIEKKFPVELQQFVKAHVHAHNMTEISTGDNDD